MAHEGQDTKETQVYVFDEDAEDTEDRRGSGGRRDFRRARGKRTIQVKGFLCNRCVLCLFISVVAIFIAVATLKAMVSSNLDGLSSQNSTMDDSSGDSEPFDQSYVPPEYILKHAKSCFGLDKNNFTVWFVDFGHWDMESLLETNVTTDLLNEFVDNNIQRTRQRMRGLNETDALGWALVVNMDGYGLAQAFDLKALGFLQDLAKRHLGFLKSVDYAIIINMSYWSRMLTGLLRPFMGDLLDRYELFGYDDWLPTLSERIPDHQLPPGYTSYVED